MFLSFSIHRKRLLSVAAIILIIGAAILLWLGPRSVALYHQVRGGRILAGVLQSDSKLNRSSFACQRLPPSGAASDRLKQAIAHLKAAQKNDPKLAQADLLLGRAYCLAGELENAVNAFQAYLRLRPHNPLGRLEMGFAYQALGQFQAARQAWIDGGVTPEDMRNLAYQAIQAGQYDDQRNWYRSWLLMEPQVVDTFTGVPDPGSLMVFASFVTLDRWQPCSWCNNPPGLFQIRDGVLEMSYQNRPMQRSWFAYQSYPNLDIRPFTELVMRVKGKPGTALTVELVIDRARSRPASYQPVPAEWTTLSFPVAGKVLNEILVGIPEPASVPSQREYQLSLDWIALK